MFTSDMIIFNIDGHEQVALLKNRSRFTLTRTSVTYDGTIPTLDCDVTFENI